VEGLEALLDDLPQQGRPDPLADKVCHDAVPEVVLGPVGEQHQPLRASSLHERLAGRQRGDAGGHADAPAVNLERLWP
jgi:hypothetical protein